MLGGGAELTARLADKCHRIGGSVPPAGIPIEGPKARE